MEEPPTGSRRRDDCEPPVDVAAPTAGAAARVAQPTRRAAPAQRAQRIRPAARLTRGRVRPMPQCPHRSARPDGHREHLAGRARIRHLLAPAERADHLPRHADRRPGGEPRGGPAAASRGRGPGQGRLDLHQLARRLRLLGARDLRHDAVHQAGRAHDVRGHRDVDRSAPARRAARRASARRCRTAACSSTSPRRASRARRRTSRSRRARCSPSASASTKHSRCTRAAPRSRFTRTWNATASSTAEQAVEYGLIDSVIESH